MPLVLQALETAPMYKALSPRQSRYATLNAKYVVKSAMRLVRSAMLMSS